jgi:hypothetical protein
MKFLFWKTCLALLAVAALALHAQQPATRQTTTAIAPLPPTSDAHEIIRRALEAEEQNGNLTRSYMWRQREVEKQLDPGGAVRLQEIRTYDISLLYDERYARLIQKDDKPLEAKDQKREDEKFEKFVARRRSETPSDRQSRLDQLKKEREEGRGFLRDFINAYNFRLAGEEVIDGNNTWVIDASPRQDFRPTQPHGDILPRLKGRLWIEKKGYHWVRVDAEAVDTIAIGLVIARIHPGSRARFERILVNNEVWMPRRYYFNASARLVLVKNAAVEEEVLFSDFRK